MCDGHNDDDGAGAGRDVYSMYVNVVDPTNASRFLIHDPLHHMIIGSKALQRLIIALILSDNTMI